VATVGVGSCSTGEARGWEYCKKLQGLAARGGAYRGVANGCGARSESVRERGLPVAGGGGPGAGSGGEARALERRCRRGVETGGRVEQRERGASDSAAARQMGKERREKVGVRAWGCHAARGCRGVWPRPADGARQWPERSTHGRRAPRVRVFAGQSGGERRLTGGPRHSAGRRCR
jgi:hypothetical protein